ncbi:hypothetical protein EV426DRAFT_538754 [Tirmania nivea]|nr:hypothetical protein EV426DRAFT_538754 [Tirmania nivea]
MSSSNPRIPECTPSCSIKHTLPPGTLHPAPQHSYTSGIPGPPRILFPPHLGPAPGPPPAPAGRLGSLDNPPPGLEVLLSTPSALQEWTYESRRQAQQVLPWVWLGSMTATRDKELLAKRGITLSIAVRSSMTAKAKLMGGGVEPNSDESLLKHRLGKIGEPVHVTLDLPAVHGAPLIATFRAAAQLIDRNYLSTFPCQTSADLLPVLQETLNPYPLGVPRPGSTLVFCETGNEKSAVVVASYIMHHYEANLVQACQVVQGRRFSVAFDDIHKFALAAWEPIFKSYREVQKARDQPVQHQLQHTSGNRRGESTGGAKKKRGFEESQYEDDGEQYSQEKIAIDGRFGTAPFRDDDPDTGMADAEEDGVVLN